MITVKFDTEQLESIIQSAIRSAISEKHFTAQKVENEPMTVQEAAKFLSLSVPTIYSKIGDKELPCMKRGKRVYFSREDLMEYLKAGRKRTITEIEAGAKDALKPFKKRGASYE